MNKNEFLKMMCQDIETEKEPQKTLYADVIDCMEIALSQVSDTFEVPADKTVKGAFEKIEEFAKKNRQGNVGCVGLYEAVEIIAKYLGVKYERVSKRFVPKSITLNLDDFYDAKRVIQILHETARFI